MRMQDARYDRTRAPARGSPADQRDDEAPAPDTISARTRALRRA